MRLAYVMLMGCSFAPAAGASSGGGDAPGPPPPGVDAHVSPDAAPDAPPDAFVNPAWPCDPQMPMSPGDVSLTPSGATFDFTQISLNSDGQVVLVTSGANVMLALSYSMQDTRCMSCTDQIEVGWIDSTGAGNRLGCVFDGSVSHTGHTTGSIAGAKLAAPTTPGDYDLRVNIGQRNHCNDGNNWWVNGAPPPANQTIVKVCVH